MVMFHSADGKESATPPSPRTVVTGTSSPSSVIASDKITSGEMIDGSTSDYIALIGKTLADKNNLKVGDTFTAYGKKVTVKGIYKSESEFLQKGKTEDILCLAYLRAMDHYDDVTDAIPLVDVVVKRQPTSYTAQLISAVIVSQQLTKEDWCAVYLLCNEVKIDDSLTFDMRQEAVDRIYAYMDLYLEGCEEQGGE